MKMLSSVHIIVSCASRKRLPPPSDLQLRSVHAQSLGDRVSQWWYRLSRHRSATMSAMDLYLGDHWAIAKTLPSVASSVGLRPSLWVASAGYGLVSVDAPMRSYSATFAGGHPDSVASIATNGITPSEIGRAWWTWLSRVQGPHATAPRSVGDIVREDPRAYILVVSSPDYVGAMEDDLLDAIQHARDPDRVIIVSSRGRFARGILGQHLILSDARLQVRLGGARTSLHIRVARKILEEAGEWALSATLLQARYRRLVARSPEAPRYDRARMTDDEVSRFIRSQLRHDSDVSCTLLLRSLRSSGLACEQFRFRSLFRAAKNGNRTLFGGSGTP